MKEKNMRLKFEKWANSELLKIQGILLLNHFTLQPISSKIESKSARAECKLNYPYKDINVCYSEELMKEWEEGKVGDVFQILVHEMCHPLTDPLYCVGMERMVSKDQMENEREALTDHIANIIIKNSIR